MEKTVAMAWIRNKKELEREVEALQGNRNPQSLEKLLDHKKELTTLLIQEEKY